MDYASLIHQISELDEQAKKDELKLVEEREKHSRTKAELGIVREYLEKEKRQGQQGQERVAALERELVEEQKLVDTLQADLDASKRDNSLLQGHFETLRKETEEMKRTYIQELETFYERLKTLVRVYPSGEPPIKSEKQPHDTDTMEMH